MAQTDIPNVLEKIKARDTDVPWYIPEIGSKLGPQAREVLEKYSKIPSQDVEAHVYKLRDDAWKVWPYPCIGSFRFLHLDISHSPYYQTLLARLRPGNQNLLDLGCCFGQELRQLVYDGVPVSSLYASDLRPDFFQLGYELFNDKSTFTAKFIAADVFDSSPENGLKEIEGEIDIVYAGSFLHLFGWEEQVQACERIVALLKPVKDSVLMGRQIGDVVSREMVHKTNGGQKMYLHNPESFRKLWDEVGEKTGTSWKTEVQVKELGEELRWRIGSEEDWDADTKRRISFVVTRL
ncbi:hypothetical protein B0O99DRAFT_595467 [Bisporella sp. PMI_857]|nr:hypothetical protein B0O99DRAFT_595467 [Bisporella sp. PMI_857]